MVMDVEGESRRFRFGVGKRFFFCVLSDEDGEGCCF
jgi:hypothetical protein